MRAKIKRGLGRTRHWTNGQLISGEAAVEIVEEDGLFFLVRLDSEGRFLADTCHFSSEEAKETAEYEYELDGEWQP